MACDPDTTITSSDIESLKADIETIDEVVESNEDTVLTKNDQSVYTLRGQLKRLGYLVPAPYAAGISFTINDGAKTIDENGVIYAPVVDELPFTTSGTWIGDDEDKFYVVQSSRDASGIDLTVNGLARDSLQSYLENKEVLSYSELRSLPSDELADGDIIWVDGHAFEIKTGSVLDNNGTLIVFNDDSNRYAQSTRSGSGRYYINDFGPDFDSAWANLVNWLRTNESNTSSSGGNIQLDHQLHETSGALTIYNDMEVSGFNFASQLVLEDNSDVNMIEFDNNKSRIKFDRFWINGNSANQSGSYRGLTDNGFSLFQWSIGSFYARDFGGAGFYVENGTSFQFDKIDVAQCGSGGQEPACVLPDQSIGDEVSVTGVDDTNYTIIALRINNSSIIQHAHFENTRQVEFVGNGSILCHMFCNGAATAIFNGSNNKLGMVSNGVSSNPLRVTFQDNGTHNEVPFNSIWNNHNTLRVLHPGDGVNPYFLEGEYGWSNVARVRPSGQTGTDTINIPCPIAMQPSGNVGSKSISVNADVDYLVEVFYITQADGNTVGLTVNDGASNVMVVTGLDSFDGSQRWAKYSAVARMGAAASQATMSISSNGTNVSGYAIAFTGYRAIESLVSNGSMEGGFTGGIADGWTTSGSGSFSQELTEVRTGSSSQKIAVSSGNTASIISSNITLRPGASYLIGGFIKIESTDQNKPVKVWFNTASDILEQKMSAQSSNTGWQAFQFVVEYDDQSGGGLNSLTVELRGQTTAYLDDVYCIPLVRKGLEDPIRLTTESPFDLSGVAETKWIHSGSARASMYLSHANITYTEGTSADTGVDIEVGRYRSSGSDSGYYGVKTTDAGQSIYSNSRINFTNHTTRNDEAVGILNNGGKTGNGEAIIEIIACPL